MRRQAVGIIFAAFTGMTASSAAVGQNVKIEKIEIVTQSPNAFEFLTRRKTDKPAKITGELRIPGNRGERMPAVLLVHGSGGVGRNIHYWVPELNKLGIATFVIDAFSGRGVKDTIANQTQVSNYAMLFDSYRALEALAKHPRIDPERIAIMGFSKGGISALYSGMDRFQEFYAPHGLKFAAHLAFYPACNTTHIDETKVGKAPIRIFHGTADDYVLIAPCRDYVARLKAAGADAAIIELPGAHHSFDNPAITRTISLPKAVTSRKCSLQEKPVGIVRQADGNPYGAASSCVERGTTVAHSPTATATAAKQVAVLLKVVFKL